MIAHEVNFAPVGSSLILLADPLHVPGIVLKEHPILGSMSECQSLFVVVKCA